MAAPRLTRSLDASTQPQRETDAPPPHLHHRPGTGRGDARRGRALPTAGCGPARVCRWQALEDPADRAPGPRPAQTTLHAANARIALPAIPLAKTLALSERELDHLLDVDHVHHEALAAVDERNGSFVAAARYVQLPDQPDVADIAIEVADDLHRQGIGTALAIQTLERARANGFTRVTAVTLHDNRPARALLRRLDFRPRSSRGHEIEFDLELTPDLATPGSTSRRGDPVHPQQPTTREEPPCPSSTSR